MIINEKQSVFEVMLSHDTLVNSDVNTSQIPRQKFPNAVHGVVGNVLNNVTEISFRIVAVQLGRFHQNR